MTFRRIVVSFFLGMICANTAQAEPIPFNTGWTHHKFPMMREVTFDISSRQLGFSATNAASTLYRPFPNGHAVPNQARFTWHLQSAPPATALDTRFGSDRPLSVSFVFAPTGAVREIARLGDTTKNCITPRRSNLVLCMGWRAKFTAYPAKPVVPKNGYVNGHVPLADRRRHSFIIFG